MKTKRLLTTIAVLLVMAAAAQAEDYGIYIYGTQVTSSNCDDLSTIRGVDEGTVYYQPSTNTLVIRDARLFGDKCGIENRNRPGLTIKVYGYCSISSNKDVGLLLKKSTTIVSGWNRDNCNLLVLSYVKDAMRIEADVTCTLENVVFEADACGDDIALNGTGVGKMVIKNSDVDFDATYSNSVMDLKSLSIKGTSNVTLHANTGGYFPMAGVTSFSLDEDMVMTQPEDGYFTSSSGCNIYNYLGQAWVNDVEFKTTAIPINETNFPDYNFRHFITNSIISPIDRDHDNYLIKSEIRQVTRMDVSYENISSLTGIKYFTSLQSLDCNNNKLTSLSNLPSSLVYLYCQNNQITSLNLGANLGLEYVYCSHNQLTSLYVDNSYGYMTSLKLLDCSYNKLTSLTFSLISNIRELDCSSNNLSSLYIGNCYYLTDLICSSNNLSSLNVASCTYLKKLGCSSNKLTALSLVANTNLESLGCSDNQLTWLELGNHPNLYSISLTNNPSIGFDAHNAIVSKLCTWSTGTNYFFPSRKITKEDVRKARDKGWTVNIDGLEAYKLSDTSIFPDANFRSFLSQQSYGSDGWIDEDEIGQTYEINVGIKQIANLKGIEIFKRLVKLFANGNNLTSIDLKGLTNLQILNVAYNQLTALDLSQNTKIQELDCQYNLISSLNLTMLPNLNIFECNNNRLGSLDVSVNQYLYRFYCYDNQLTSLVLPSASTILREVWCFANQLSENAMWNTVFTLPRLQSGSGNFVVTSDLSTEGNFFSMNHNSVAKDKGWGVYSFVNYHYVPYEDLVPTGVESVRGSDDGQTVIDMDAPLYNLRGQRVSHPVKGSIYIQNGKKVRY